MSTDKMNLRLTISGLCVVVLHSEDERPYRPDAVEILCVDACHHHPRLAYWPEDRSSGKGAVGDLMVDPRARKSVALDIAEQVLQLEVAREEDPPFRLEWGDPAERRPRRPAAERQMNWVPPVSDLGIDAIRRATAQAPCPAGASARLILPPGDLYATDMVRDWDSGELALWEFKDSKVRALANSVVYEATDLSYAKISWGGENLTFEWEDARTVEIGLGNDVVKLAGDYSSQQTELGHLSHLAGLALGEPEIVIPQLYEGADGGLRTGHPICPLTLCVNQPVEGDSDAADSVR